MKHILLTAALAATALSAAAAPENLTIATANDGYNVTIKAPTDGVQITSTSNWGEWRLTTETFNVSEYPSYKIVYSTESSEFQLKSIDETNKEGYKPLASGSNVEVLGSFANLNSMSGDVTLFSMQAKKSGLSMTIHSAALVSANGTEVPINGKIEYGMEAVLPELSLPYTVAYSGQWGAIEVLGSDGSAITFAKGGTPDVFTVKFAEPTAIPLNIEFENTVSGGSIYCPVDAGASDFTFTLDDAALAGANDGAGIDGIDHMWIKSTGEAAGEIVISKLTRQSADDIVELPAIYLLGDVNNWAAAPEFQFQPTERPDIYTLSVSEMSGSFKIADADFSTVDYGGDGTPVPFGTAVTLTARGADMTFAEAPSGPVTFTLNTDAWTLTAIAEPSGISAVEADDSAAPARWFDLRGHELSAPAASGLYIEVRGTKATKIVK